LILPASNLQPAPTLPAQLKIGRIFLAAGWALHVAGSDRGIFVGFNHMFAAFIVFVALDPYFRAGVVNRYFWKPGIRDWLSWIITPR